jgi:hypothetical protein
MTTDQDAMEELRETLRVHAAIVRAPEGVAQRVAENAHRVRSRRRAIAATAVVACLVALSPVLVRAFDDDDTGPVEPVPTVTSLRWNENLQGVDLPVGPALSVAYAAGDTATVGSQSYVFDGKEVTALLTSPTGPVVVARTTGTNLSSITVFDESGQRSTLAGPVKLVGSVVRGLGPDGEPHLAYATDGPGGPAVYEGPLLDVQPLASGERYQAAGFLGGEPVFDSISRPGMLTQFHTAGVPDAGGEARSEVIGNVSPTNDGGTVLAGWRDLGDSASAFYTVTSSACTLARDVPGFGIDAWMACSDESDVFVVGTDFGALGDTVYDLSSGDETRKFDLSPAASEGVFYDLEAIGWESPTNVIIRIAGYEVADPRSQSPANGSYVAVRCSVVTGACERLPHPVDVVADLLA